MAASLRVPVIASLAATLVIFAPSLAVARAAEQANPPLGEVIRLEQLVQMQPPAHPLNTYARYYSYEIFEGRRVIFGYFKHYGTPGRYLYKSPVPPATDQGCEAFYVRYDPTTEEILYAHCDGVG